MVPPDGGIGPTLESHPPDEHTGTQTRRAPPEGSGVGSTRCGAADHGVPKTSASAGGGGQAIDFVSDDIRSSTRSGRTSACRELETSVNRVVA
jgi:hypothetical protein